MIRQVSSICVSPFEVPFPKQIPTFVVTAPPTVTEAPALKLVKAHWHLCTPTASTAAATALPPATMRRPVPPAVAFQAAVAVTSTRLRRTLPRVAPPRHPYHIAAARRPRRTPLLAATARPSAPPPTATVLLDELVPVPSTLPSDRHHPVKVALRAEALPGRRRRVVGGVDVDATPARVWAVLTAYAHVADYMPNILSSVVERRDGEVFLEQVGLISRKLRLRSRMLVKVTEDLDRGEIAFTRVNGRDFAEFEGRYFLRELDGGGVRLDYEMVAVPFPLFPMAMVERKIFKEVPKMLAAVREEALLGRYVDFEDE